MNLINEWVPSHLLMRTPFRQPHPSTISYNKCQSPRVDCTVHGWWTSGERSHHTNEQELLAIFKAFKLMSCNTQIATNSMAVLYKINEVDGWEYPFSLIPTPRHSVLVEVHTMAHLFNSDSCFRGE